jgi:biopolymer transport protein ExbD
MEVLETHDAGNRRRRSFALQQKKSTRVDLTPMVDLGFLLVTFFFVTTAWTEPGVMKIILPANGDSTRTSVSAALTIIPLQENKLFYFEGNLQTANQTGKMGTVGFSIGNGIGKIIREKQAAMDKNPLFTGGRRDLVVIIKPSKASSFASLVKIFDEMAIDGVTRFALEDIGKEEMIFLRSKEN